MNARALHCSCFLPPFVASCLFCAACFFCELLFSDALAAMSAYWAARISKLPHAALKSVRAIEYQTPICFCNHTPCSFSPCPGSDLYLAAAASSCDMYSRYVSFSFYAILCLVLLVSENQTGARLPHRVLRVRGRHVRRANAHRVQSATRRTRARE